MRGLITHSHNEQEDIENVDGVCNVPLPLSCKWITRRPWKKRDLDWGRGVRLSPPPERWKAGVAGP